METEHALRSVQHACKPRYGESASRNAGVVNLDHAPKRMAARWQPAHQLRFIACARHAFRR
jgi:hypothetical protein